jgi:hypothetical protein
MSAPPGSVLDVGTVVDLERYRKRRRAAPPAPKVGTAELELAIRRLTPLVRQATAGGRSPDLETELLAAVGAVSSGLHDEAMRRLEALTARLEAEASPPTSPVGKRRR